MNKNTNRCSKGSRRKLPRRHQRSGSHCHKGRVKKACSEQGIFSEDSFLHIVTTDSYIPLPSQNTSNKAVYSYAIVNRGQESAAVKLEISPNGEDFAVDMEGVVEQGSMGVVVPAKFLRFTRLAVQSQEAGKPTLLSIYFQAQKAR